MLLDEYVLVYVLEPEHPEYHVPSDDDIQVKDRPYADDASSNAESPGYIVNSDSMEEDTDEDYINYPDELEDGEEDDDEDPEEDPSEEHELDDDDDDDDIDDEDEEPIEDKEEEEHLALADSSVVLVVDPVPSAGDIETVRIEPPMSASTEARIAEHVVPPQEEIYNCTTAPPPGYDVAESSIAELKHLEMSWTIARAADRVEDVGYVRALQASKHRMVTSIEEVNLRIGIRALSYRELGCISYMSNLDELRHTDNTTLIPPRLPDTLPQVYHRRSPTLGLLILPSVLPFPLTIRCTARMSVLPIEPNLAERVRISAINLDDYQLDPITPPPSPLSPFSMAAYQQMIAEMDPTRREEALTAYGTKTSQSLVLVLKTVLTVCMTCLRGQLHTILEDMEYRYLNACLEELEAFLTLWDVKPRVEESSLEMLSVDELITQLRQVCEDAEDHASNAQEEAR
ncbi:hypothetical protein Tco_0990342 [Tanacetum coccineum]|uniref:Uncharacterized protein n=1 Tax=Tanacetum coccineum TaxID=301880 RepID=A0ABQ5EW74_9ASTR